MARNDDDILRTLEGRQFRQVKITYDVDGDAEYIGKHRKPDAATSDDFWEISKFIYNVGKDVTDIKQTRGVWDDRATLF
jgi:hypothetical protein